MLCSHLYYFRVLFTRRYEYAVASLMRTEILLPVSWIRGESYTLHVHFYNAVFSCYHQEYIPK